MKLNRLLPLNLLSLSLLALAGSASAGGMDSAPGAFEVTLSREACYGFCPVYTVRANGDGQVRWQGGQHVQQVGAAQARVAPARVAALKATAQAIHFFALKNEYLDMAVSDLPYASVTVRLGNAVKTVRYYRGDRNVPAALLRFADQIDRELNTAAWIGKKNF